jgi:hypothetical protein
MNISSRFTKRNLLKSALGFVPPAEAISSKLPTYVKPPKSPGAPVTSVTTLFDTISQVVGYAQALFWILAVVMGIYSAFLYLTSSGSPEKVGKATKTLIFAAVACAVAIVAYSIPLIVNQFVNPSA